MFVSDTFNAPNHQNSLFLTRLWGARERGGGLGGQRSSLSRRRPTWLSATEMRCGDDEKQQRDKCA
jgi:hypothetical protein